MTKNPNARTQAVKKDREVTNAKNLVKNLDLIDSLGIERRNRTVTKLVPGGKPGQVREISVVKPVRPSKLIRTERRARARMELEDARRAAIAAVAAATTPK